jgi:hypothetical protein
VRALPLGAMKGLFETGLRYPVPKWFFHLIRIEKESGTHTLRAGNIVVGRGIMSILLSGKMKGTEYSTL